MVRRAVPSLQARCLHSLESLMARFSLHTAKLIIKLVPDQEEHHLDLDKEPGLERPEASYTFERQDLLQMTVDLYRGWLLDHTVCYLYDEVSRAVLRGLERATRIHRNSWTRTTDNRVFTKVLYGVVKFAETVVFPTQRALLLDCVPQVLRNKLYSHVHEMPRLAALNLGSGSGGTVTEAFEEKFIFGISALNNLSQLTLRYDCTDKILEVQYLISSRINNIADVRQ